jgi:hypothetical protein
LDRAIVDKNVPAALLFNETVPLRVIKPLNLPSRHAPYLPTHLICQERKRAWCLVSIGQNNEPLTKNPS